LKKTMGSLPYYLYFSSMFIVYVNYLDATLLPFLQALILPFFLGAAFSGVAAFLR
jgi:hypothetical protein